MLELPITEEAAVAAKQFRLLLPASPRYAEKKKWDRTVVLRLQARHVDWLEDAEG